MSIISLIVTIVVVGFLLWAVQTYIPMEAQVKRILTGIVIIVLVLWIVSALFGWGPVGNVRIG